MRAKYTLPQTNIAAKFTTGTDAQISHIEKEIRDLKDLVNTNYEELSEEIKAKVSEEEFETFKDEVRQSLLDYYEDLIEKYEEVENHINEVVDGMGGDENIILNKDGNKITITTKKHTYNQSVASNTWTIHHGLNKRCPRVTVVDTAGSIFYPPVDFVDDNTCVVHLIGAMAGTAYLE